ncbi:MAG: xylan 1,4-beta-xylosidase, partial [Oscillospiraceae bacterium]|nr:xylan 1,4-beta-xylosidase [Oscillospiraceae bacterium]
GCGCAGKISVRIDSENGEEIGVLPVGTDGGALTVPVKCVTGRHAVYLVAETDYSGWTSDYFKSRNLFELKSFVFMK